MAKRFYDIVPPRAKKSGAKSKGQIKKILSGKISKRDKEKLIAMRPKLILAGSCVLVVLVFAYLYIKLPYLNVEVQPATNAMAFNQQATADKSAEVIDLQAGKIPAQIIEAERELFQDFPATGSASNEGLATGVITVYNKYNPATPLNFKAKTRFISDAGKYFVSVSKISIPAAKYVNGKLVPGSVDVKVIAVESGAQYNIGPSNFAIPGLVGTAFYSNVYGVSKDSMAGGFESSSKLVTKTDLSDAKTALSKKVQDLAGQSLKEQADANGFVLYDNAIVKTITEDEPSVKAGAQIDSFNYKMKAKASALVFAKADLEKFAKDYLNSQVPDGQTVLEKSFSLEYNSTNIDLAKNKISLQMKISASTYPEVDTKKTASSLQGKNSDDINSVIYNDFKQQVSALKIHFWPFWVNKAPKNLDRIEINLIFP